MKNPWLSVLIPTYNGDAFLAAALNSIHMQRDANIECIAIDDASNDGSMNILHSFSNRLPLEIVQTSGSRNWVRNTNYALSLATGDYVCFLHQDDLWLESRLFVFREILSKHPEIELLLAPSLFIDQKGNRMGIWRCPLPADSVPINPEIILQRLLVQNFIAIPAPIFKRESALKVGGLDESLWFSADWDFWLKLTHTCTTMYHPNPLTAFRIHKNSQTILRSKQMDLRNQMEIPFHRHYGYLTAPNPILKSICLASRFSIDINVLLANIMHHNYRGFGKIAISFLKMDPFSMHRYCRDSRILERIAARIRAIIKNHWAAFA